MLNVGSMLGPIHCKKMDLRLPKLTEVLINAIFQAVEHSLTTDTSMQYSLKT